MYDTILVDYENHGFFCFCSMWMLLSTKEMIGVKKDTFPSDGMETNSDQSECAIG